jgi:hypothetical protein
MPTPEKPKPQDLEIARLIAAGVVNPDFATELLTNTRGAINKGLQGEKFALDGKSTDRVAGASESSKTLAELADKLKPQDTP